MTLDCDMKEEKGSHQERRAEKPSMDEKQRRTIPRRTNQVVRSLAPGQVQGRGLSCGRVGTPFWLTRRLWCWCVRGSCLREVRWCDFGPGSAGPIGRCRSSAVEWRWVLEAWKFALYKSWLINCWDENEKRGNVRLLPLVYGGRSTWNQGCGSHCEAEVRMQACPIMVMKAKKATPIGCYLNLVDLIEVLYQPSPCWNGIYRDLNMILSFDRRTSAAKLSFNGPCRGRYVKASLLQNWRSINKRVQCSLLGNMQQWKSQHLALQLILIKL